MSWRSEELGETGLWVDSEVGRSRLVGDDERALWLEQRGQWRDRMGTQRPRHDTGFTDPGEKLV